MIRYMLQDLYSNKYIRISFLVFSALILASILYQKRIGLSNFIDNLFARPQFDNPYNWNGPFAYSENTEKAFKNYQKGMEDLLELAVDLYDAKDISDENLWQKKFSFTENWDVPLQPKAASLIHTLLADTGKFCENSFYMVSARKNWDLEKRLDTRARKEGGGPYDFAITENNINKIREKILEADEDYFSYAIQYKPDFYPAYNLQEDLYFATCKKDTPYAWWEKAVSYIEYKHSKKIYFQDVKQYENFTSYELNHMLFENLKKDSSYIFYLRNLFFRSYRIIPDVESQVRKSWSVFTLSGNKDDLMDYVDSLRKKARYSDPTEAGKIHDKIYALEYPGIEYEYRYVAALAESSFYAGNYPFARKYIDIIIQQNLSREKDETKFAFRMDLILRLKGF